MLTSKPRHRIVAPDQSSMVVLPIDWTQENLWHRVRRSRERHGRKHRRILGNSDQMPDLETLPYETPSTESHTIPHISYSQMRSYTTCPLAWRLSRAYQPEFIPASRLLGSAFHAAAEAFYKTRFEDRYPNIRDIKAAYDTACMVETEKNAARNIPVRYSAKVDTPFAMRELAMRMIEAFYAHASTAVGEVMAVEKEFAVMLSQDLPVVKSRIDLVEICTGEDGAKRLRIVDFKTSAKRIKAEDMDPEQLDLYALAMKQSGVQEQLRLPLCLDYVVVTKTKVSEIITIAFEPDPVREQRLLARFRHIWRAMSEGVCYPFRGWHCTNCGYQARCAKWPES